MISLSVKRRDMKRLFEFQDNERNELSNLDSPLFVKKQIYPTRKFKFFIDLKNRKYFASEFLVSEYEVNNLELSTLYK